MSLYEKDVVESRERDERGEGVGVSSTERLECVEGEDASDARSTSSSGVDMLINERKGLGKCNLIWYYCCRIVVLNERDPRALEMRINIHAFISQ